MIKRRSLFTLVLLAVSLAEAASLQVELRVPAGGLPRDQKAKVVVAPASNAGAPMAVEAALPGSATFEVPPGSVWQVTVEAPGSWSRPVIAMAGAAPAVVELLPAG